MANIFENRSSTTFTATETTNLGSQHTAYSGIINPKMVTLTDEELNTLPSIDVDNYVFVQDTITACDADGVAMLPPTFAAMVPELVKDNTFYKQLDVEKAWLYDQIKRIESTQRVVAAEAYRVSNGLYKQFDNLADAGVAGAASRRDALKVRYNNNGGGRPPAQNG